MLRLINIGKYFARKVTIVAKKENPPKPLSKMERAYKEGLIEEITDEKEIKNMRESHKPDEQII